MEKYKLTDHASALLSAKPKAILEKGGRRMRLSTLTDADAEFLLKPDDKSLYVEPVATTAKK